MAPFALLPAHSRAICPARVASQYSRISPPKPSRRSTRPSFAMQLSSSASSAGLKTQVASTWRIPSSRYPELVFPAPNISCSKMASRIGVSTVGSVIHQFAVGCRPGRACCGCSTVGGNSATPRTFRSVLIRQFLESCKRTSTSECLSEELSKARSCLVVSQAPKEGAWNCDLLCDRQLPSMLPFESTLCSSWYAPSAKSNRAVVTRAIRPAAAPPQAGSGLLGDGSEASP